MNVFPWISMELRNECKELFQLCDEFKSPDKLRAFVSVKDLELVRECVVFSSELDFDQLITRMLTRGRSFLEPALFDLLDALAFQYDGDVKGQACKDLKERLRNAIPAPEDPEQADYQRLVETGSTLGDEQGIARKAQEWIDAAGHDLDELVLRITLAVFNGTSFEVIERAKNDLMELLQGVLPPPRPPNGEAPTAARIPIPLMGRLRKAGATQTKSRPPDWKRVIELPNPELASEALTYAWELYSERDWRQRLIEWLKSYAAGRPADVRTRAAIAAGKLAITDYRFVRDNLLHPWVRATSYQSQYRTAIGMALGVIIREPELATEVQTLLSQWSDSGDQAERWAATRAYIYVGAYCRPVSEVIAQWRKIAASEAPTRDVQLEGYVYVRLTNPLHMSLVDAMIRFFLNIAQLPDEERREPFEGTLEGLADWIADDSDDAWLGSFMFTTLGKWIAPITDQAEHGLPMLLGLMDERPPASSYGKQLASLFSLTLRKAASIIEAKELLCEWTESLDRPDANAPSYFDRMQVLLTEIIASDGTGEMRGRLIACLRDCAGSPTASRLLASL